MTCKWAETDDAHDPTRCRTCLREAVEWKSVADTRRMVQGGSPAAVYAGMRTHRPDRPRAVAHYRVIAETDKADVLAMCDLVEREGTSGPNIFQRIDGAKAGAEPARPHDDAGPDVQRNEVQHEQGNR